MRVIARLLENGGFLLSECQLALANSFAIESSRTPRRNGLDQRTPCATRRW